MIDIRKLAAVDMVIHGTRLITAEFAIGIMLPLILGWLSIRSFVLGLVQPAWETILGLWLIGIAVNYVPLFIYAVLITRAGTVKAEGQAELAQVKRYSVQQVVLLIPFLVMGLALMQEISRRTERWNHGR